MKAKTKKRERVSIRKEIAQFKPSTALLKRARELKRAFEFISEMSDQDIYQICAADAKTRPTECHNMRFIRAQGKWLDQTRIRAACDFAFLELMLEGLQGKEPAP